MSIQHRRADLSIYVGDLFDSAAFVRATVSGCDNATICTLAELLDEFVLGVYDERRIKRGELVSLHYLVLSDRGVQSVICFFGCV